MSGRGEVGRIAEQSTATTCSRHPRHRQPDALHQGLQAGALPTPIYTPSLRGFFYSRATQLGDLMQDLWFLLLIVIFAALTFGLVAGCAALGASK
jgi:hypothetical protein